MKDEYGLKVSREWSSIAMNIVITGGGGFIGLHLAQFHLRRNDKVFLLDNLFKSAGVVDTELAQIFNHPRAEFHEVDLTRPVETGKPQSADVVYHLAAINGTRLFYEMPYRVASANLLITLNLLDWLQGVNVGRLIYSSTSEVYAAAVDLGIARIPTDESATVAFPQPTAERFSYGASKFMSEFLCRQFGRTAGIPVSVVRYHNIYGPRMGMKHVIPEFCARLLAGENPFSLHGGSETRSFCYIDDAVEATYLIAVTPACADEIIHVGNSREEIAIEALARKMMSLEGVSFPIVEKGRRDASVTRRCPDTAKLKGLTGFEARVTLDDGLRRTMLWYNEYLANHSPVAGSR